jgi:beta-galactosidase GanA
VAGAAAQTLTIDGANFLSMVTVTYNATAHTPTFVNSTQLSVSPSASEEATAAIYPAVVTNPSPGGDASNSVNWTAHPLVPVITAQPQSQSVTAPAAATFSVTASGLGSLSYQWYKNGAAISVLATAFGIPAESTLTVGKLFTFFGLANWLLTIA